MYQTIKDINTGYKNFFIFFIALNLLTLIMFCIYGDIFTGHDYYFHIERIKSLSGAIQEGNYPGYIDYTAIDGYGYLVRAFYPDIVLVPFAYLSQFVGVVMAYKVMIYVSTILCGVFMYQMLWHTTKEYNIAFIGSLLYTFCYYRLFDVFLRAAVGEFLAITFIPLVFLGIYFIMYGDSKKWYYLSFGGVLLLFSHVVTTLIVSFFAILFVVSQYKRFSETVRVKRFLIAVSVAIIISSAFTLPFFQHYIGSQYYLQVNLKDPLAEEGLGSLTLLLGFIAGIKPLFRSLGVGTGLLLTLCLLSRIFIRKRNRSVKIADILVIIGLLVVLTSHKLFPWHLFHFLDFIQFPWKLYTIVVFFFSISGAIYLSELSFTRTRKVTIYAFVFSAIITLMILNREEIEDRRLDTVLDRTPTFSNQYNQVGLEYIPAKVPSIEFIRQRGTVIIANSSDTITSIKKDQGTLIFNPSIEKETIFELPLFYYKGYEAIQNNNKLLVSESNNGLVQIKTKDSGTVNVKYVGTFIDRTSWIVSLVGILMLLLYIFIQRKKNKPEC